MIIRGCFISHQLDVVSCVTMSHRKEGSCKFRLHQDPCSVRIKVCHSTAHAALARLH